MKIRVNALLDPGADTSFVTNRVHKVLELPEWPEQSVVCGFNTRECKDGHHIDKLLIQSVDGRINYIMYDLASVEELGELPVKNYSAVGERLGIQVEAPAVSGVVDMIIGCPDHALWTLAKPPIIHNKYLIYPTILGNIVSEHKFEPRDHANIKKLKPPPRGINEDHIPVRVFHESAPATSDLTIIYDKSQDSIALQPFRGSPTVDLTGPDVTNPFEKFKRVVYSASRTAPELDAAIEQNDAEPREELDAENDPEIRQIEALVNTIGLIPPLTPGENHDDDVEIPYDSPEIIEHYARITRLAPEKETSCSKCKLGEVILPDRHEYCNHLDESHSVAHCLTVRRADDGTKIPSYSEQEYKHVKATRDQERADLNGLYEKIATKNPGHENNRKQVHDLIASILEELRRNTRLEEFPDDKGNTVEENRCIQAMNDTYCRVNGRAQIAPLWKPGQPEKGLNNYGYALKRAWSVKKKLEKPSYDSLQAIFDKYEEEDIIEKVPMPEDPYKEEALYWAMFPVFNPKSETTPVRPVMDGAAQCLNGKSINQHCFSCGPNMINDLTLVLTRFRRYNVGVMGDVSKMFLKILLPEEYRPYYRFLWIDWEGNVIIYQFKGHLFGNNSSPTVSIFAVHKNAQEFQEKHPRAVETIIHSTIVDDHIDSVETPDEGKDLIMALVEIYNHIGLKIAKFNTNSIELSKSLPDEIVKSETMISFDAYVEEKLLAPGNDSKLPHVRTLGQYWNMHEDYFSYGDFDLDLNAKWTKIAVLSQAHKVFDPLGYATPVTLEAKQILQDLWGRECGWKDPLTDEEVTRWQQWLLNLPKLSSLQFDRCLIPGRMSDVDHLELHVFTDASKDAYAAAAYLRVQYKDGKVLTNFIMARSRVKPRQVNRTIPKLELIGIELGSLLAQHVNKSLEVPNEHIHLWSDSVTALQWLRTNPDHLQVLAHNYVKKITSRWDRNQIHWVKGEDNPADLPTRPKTVDELIELSQLWREGPKWLRKEPEHWPKTPALSDTAEVLTEVKREFKLFNKTNHVLLAQRVIMNVSQKTLRKWGKAKPEKAESSDFFVFNPLSNFSDDKYRTVVRVLARVIKMVRLRTFKVTYPDACDHVVARKILLHEHQRNYFADVYKDVKRNLIPKKHPLGRLNAVVIPEQVGRRQLNFLRLSGRLSNADHLKPETRQPYLIHPDGKYTALISRHHHTTTLSHAGGFKCMMCEINSSHFIVGSLTGLRRSIKECLQCRRANPKPAMPKMAPFPNTRIAGEKAVSPFTYTVIDCAGPWKVRVTQRRAREKRWLLVGVCCQTHAVHLEILPKMDVDAFLNAFRRFGDRQRTPSVVYCDRGTNFVGAANHFAKIAEKAGAQSPVEFNFSPAHASHFNGLAERTIGSIKSALRPLIEDGQLTDDELLTVFCSIERVLNDRPITWTGDPTEGEPEALTPNHFLMKGRASENLDAAITLKDVNLHVKAVEEIQRRFHERLMKEMLQSKHEYFKWSTDAVDPIQLGDVVILLDERIAGKWYPLARVTNVSPGTDGVNRRFTVRIMDTEYERAANKLALLLRPEQERNRDYFVRPPPHLRPKRPNKYKVKAGKKRP